MKVSPRTWLLIAISLGLLTGGGYALISNQDRECKEFQTAVEEHLLTYFSPLADDETERNLRQLVYQQGEVTVEGIIHERPEGCLPPTRGEER